MLQSIIKITNGKKEVLVKGCRSELEAMLDKLIIDTFGEYDDENFYTVNGSTSYTDYNHPNVEFILA